MKKWFTWLPLILLLLFALLKVSDLPKKEPDTKTWIEKAVDREFAVYDKTGINKASIDSAWNKLRKRKEFRRYKIINSQVYGEPGRIKNLLTALTQHSPTPDVDFIYFNEDRIKKSHSKRPAFRCGSPILVSAKDRSLSQFILFSDWLYDPTDNTSGWNAAFELVNQNYAHFPWASKIDKLFWRGSPFDGQHFHMYDFQNWTTIPRGQLIYQSRQYPDLIDAAFSSYPPKCSKKDLARCYEEMGPESFVPLIDQLQYKYHLLIDGVTCTFPGTHWKLLSGSLCFKQESCDIMYFYPELIARIHYIPVKNDLKDLRDKISWAKLHDKEAEEIAINARAFALTHLTPENILDYCHAVLVRYASLQTFKPQLEEEDFLVRKF